MSKNRVSSIEGCESPHRALGYCNKHWLRSYKHGDPNKGPKIGCEVGGCEKSHFGKGFCQLHYDQEFPKIKRTSALKKYNWTPELWDFVFDYQTGKCAIDGCETEILKGTGNSAADHDHLTSEPRAILCGPCNRSLGALGENIDRIKGLLKYAEQCRNVKAWED